MNIDILLVLTLMLSAYVASIRTPPLWLQLSALSLKGFFSLIQIDGLRTEDGPTVWTVKLSEANNVNDYGLEIYLI